MNQRQILILENSKGHFCHFFTTPIVKKSKADTKVKKPYDICSFVDSKLNKVLHNFKCVANQATIKNISVSPYLTHNFGSG